jgi:hypothetical protein
MVRQIIINNFDLKEVCTEVVLKNINEEEKLETK